MIHPGVRRVTSNLEPIPFFRRKPESRMSANAEYDYVRVSWIPPKVGMARGIPAIFNGEIPCHVFSMPLGQST